MDKDFLAALEKAIDQSNEGKWKQARSAFDRLIKANPDRMQPRFERAMVLLNLDQDEAATADLDYVLAREPDYPGARDWFAKAQAGLGKPLLAGETKLAGLKSLAVDHWSANGQAWADCAEYFLKAGKRERALAALDLYFEGYEGRQKGYETYLSAPHRMRARVLLALGRNAEALVSAERAKAQVKTVPADQFMLVMCQSANGQHDKALAGLTALRADYAGTLPYNEAVAVLRGYGLDVS